MKWIFSKAHGNHQSVLELTILELVSVHTVLFLIPSAPPDVSVITHYSVKKIWVGSLLFTVPGVIAISWWTVDWLKEYNRFDE